MGKGGCCRPGFIPLRRKHLPDAAGTVVGPTEPSSRRGEGVWKLESIITNGTTRIRTAKKEAPFSIPFW